ncbi:hypothetical protein IEO21_06956 [Rhodonia placenta]|uniref:F-box domain-containing protein n=1 Tax=Rhodonia placenta TaxID=104341 RepID=A0A8H7NZ36_9APHY|nr:hypothetical protein IEO21_06956 [Postia placenta]
MVDNHLTCSEASSLLEKLSNSCGQWRSVATCFQLECIENVLLNSLSDVRMSLNAQRPINRLPVEILSKIFRRMLSPFDIRGDFLVWDSLFDFKDTNVLLPLTHVCRRWRDVALDTPTLWTTLNSYFHPGAVDEYYFRSQSAPLKVWTTPNIYFLLNNVQQLWHTDGQRIQSFASYRGCDSDLPTSYAHGLRALAARDCVLQGDVSHVKVLVLRSVDWHLPGTLTNLTHLFLANNQLHIVDLFRVLSIAPRLEDLGLSAISAMESFDAHEDIPAVTLQHLRRLAIHHPDRNIVSGLFSHVGLPTCLAASFELCEVPDLQWLVPLTQNDAQSLHISTWEYSASIIAAGPSKAVRFSSPKGSEMVRWIVALLSHFQLKDLWIKSTYSDEFEEAIIEHTPWVETLHLGPSDCVTMIGALLDNPSCWLKLTKVVLLHPPQPTEILDLAESRARLGCPLEELECHERRSMISEKYSQDLEKIRSHVGVVRLIEDGPIALPLPDVCTDGVPSPYFWPEEWGELNFRIIAVLM